VVESWTLTHDLVTPVRDLPTGTVTFLFTDIEGSTRLLHELGAEAYGEALAEHRRVLRDAFARHGGVEVDTQGDAFFYAFPTAPGALDAAREGTDELAAGPIQVRIGVHTGTPHVAEEGYVGGDVHRAARIGALGNGGQVLVSSSTAELVEVELRDLGLHRLKDLSAAERIYQLGNGEFPPLKSLHQTNLPVPSTPFVGRERELAEVAGLLGRADVRLLTLTGPGGTGKTRLASQAAGMASDRYPHGVWWVPLAAIRDPELVLESASQVLGAKNGLADHIGDKSLLLLFDNFEQVVDAAGDLAGVLASCRNAEFLVTSREPLRVTGEQAYAVPPFVHEEGVGFFLARARAVKTDFQPDDAVSEICRRLDDLPLALELAAARVTALSSAQILERLEQRLPLLTGGARDLPERQRTLRGAIEWSHELLGDDEQRLFGRLSVFRGGCTLEATEKICDADLDTLQSLVDKSLLRFADDRYWMLETIREYAAERLEESSEAEELRGRHAEYFLALAEEAEPHLQGGDPAAWLDRLEPDHDNLRATFDVLTQAGETQRLLQLVGALHRLWTIRGHFAEGMRRLESALAADERRTLMRARALNAAGDIAGFLGERPERRWLEEALEISVELGDVREAAVSRYFLATIWADVRDWEKLRDHCERSVAEFEAVGEQSYALMARRTRAWACEELGDHDRYVELTKENLARARAQGNKRIEARSLGVLVDEAFQEGRLDDARRLKEQSFRIDLELGNVVFVAIGMRTAAQLNVDRAPEAAARLLARADATFAELGASQESWMLEERELILVAVKAAMDDAAFEQAWGEGLRMTQDEGVALALEVLDADA
jgi:predicted ATPase/class 3 adenylate cyclase